MVKKDQKKTFQIVYIGEGDRATVPGFPGNCEFINGEPREFTDPADIAAAKDLIRTNKNFEEA
ncbi:hypothetical protein ACTFSJ_27775 [Bacillus cereus group sp. MYBK12-2]|uniref:hypothetical protein n=1 Tax=Bacillus cereus group sp. MYBK12-2 TaxID=3450689 RepID=UPI003301919C|nr:hypothetical protein [Bacillus pacificus]HDR7653581.1 hypothetical protein [Bacillus pacificus]